KDLIDEWEDVEREVDGELPTILHGKTFLVAEDFITDRVARYVGFVKCPHQKLIETGLYGQGFFVGGMNCVADQRIVERNEVAAGTIERIAKAASFSGEGPAVRADGLSAIIREVAVMTLINDGAIAQGTRQQRKFAAHPVDDFVRRRDLIFRHFFPVIYQAKARPSMQRNDPEPIALAHEMIG